jgi:deoxyadenosine/deoxycytidine kinase
MIVWISGPTGAGKSSLSHLFKAMNYEVLQERLPTPVFEAFKNQPRSHCALLQQAIMESRADQWRGSKERNNVVFDRSVDEDIEIFGTLHHTLGNLSDNEYQLLKVLSEKLAKTLPKPDLIIYMSADFQTLKNRLLADSHPRIIVESLELQISLYSKWLRSRKEEVLQLNNSKCTLGVIQRLLRIGALC